MLYPNLPPPNSKLLSLVPLNPALSGMNSKSKLENTVRLFRTHLDYWRPKVLEVKDDFKEEEEIEQVISDNEIEINSLDDKDDIKIKKVGV